MAWSKDAVYCTTYCNKGHRMFDGRPVGHECYVLPPAALEREWMGQYDKAIEAIEAARPLRTHKGLAIRYNAQKIE